MGAVFVSYRRGDSEGQARALYIELVNRVGKDSVFMDVDSIALGRDFRQILQDRLGSCELMLALIGPNWLNAEDGSGNRRLETSTDLVRLEIAAGLKRNIPVIPVLLQGAQMPAPERLPEDIRDLTYRHGFELDHSTWESDVKEMFNRLGLRAPTTAHSQTSTPAQASLPVLAGWLNRRWLLAVGAMVVVAGTVGLSVYLNRRNEIGPPQDAGPAVVQGDYGVAEKAPTPNQTAQPLTPSATAVSPSLGAIRIANLIAGNVEVYSQSSSGTNYYAPGYVGTLSPASPTLQVPAGTYKLKFDQLFVEHVEVGRGQSDIVLGAISIPNLARTVEVYSQSSSGTNYYAPGYVGTLSPASPTLQVPAGTYKLKFDRLFVENVRVEAGKTVTAGQ